MTRNESESSFKRRKFTITERLDDVLEDLAEQNYQGNVSLCLRAAIEDHQQTLNGTDSGLVAQQLLQRVEGIASQQEQILTTLESIENDPDEEAPESNPSSRMNHLPEHERRILTVLETTDAELRIADLAERLDLPTARIQPAIGTLIDFGLITPTEASPTRFRLAGRSRNENGGM